MPEEKVIHFALYNPRESIFKTRASEKAEYTAVVCSASDRCGLHKRGKCSMAKPVFIDRCPHGSLVYQKGPSKASKSLSSWVGRTKEEYSGVPRLDSPECKMAFVGEHVYLPYSHMTLCKTVPFLAHGSPFVFGICFLPVGAWTVETVEALVLFRPQALMGGEITSYQKEVVPKFLQHLREVDPPMYKRLVERRPELDKEPVYVGRKALLRTLNFPLDWDANVNAKYPVRWHWDGKVLTTTSDNAYSPTWGGSIYAESVAVTVVPKADAAVVVRDNSWVGAETVFVD